MRKELEAAQAALEMESDAMRRRHQQTVAELSDTIDNLTRAKNKYVNLAPCKHLLAVQFLLYN